MIPDDGEFLMTYSVGTPPFKLYGIVDTGSDCEHCYNQTTPIFNPLKSSSYKNWNILLYMMIDQYHKEILVWKFLH